MTTVSPWNFPSEYNYKDIQVRYLNFREPFQGGPEIAELEINNRIIPRKLFGGPLLFYNSFIVIPEYMNTFLKKGFRLSFIDINSLKAQSIGDIQVMILLSEIKNNRIYYYTDMENKNLEHFSLCL